MNIAFDCDSVIFKPYGEYKDRVPYPESIQTLRKLKSQGHKIIVHTSRYMGRFNNDTNKAMDAGYKELKTSLDKFSIPYDGIFWKVSADIFVDDRAYNLNSEYNPQTKWKNLEEFVDIKQGYIGTSDAI